MFDILEELNKEDENIIHCIIMSGKNTTIYKLHGTCKDILFKYDVNLPNKQRKGGQSQLRFERLCKEARFNYVSKMLEEVNKLDKDIPLLIAGSTDLKYNLKDRITRHNILNVIDIQYDQRTGLEEVLHKYPNLFTNIKIEKERKYINRFFELLNIDEDMIVYGVDNILTAINMGALEVLISCEDNGDKYLDICNTYNTEFFSLSSFLPEANQIKEGFGGYVGILRYKIEQNIDG